MRLTQSERTRRDIFAWLVKAQDAGATVKDSREIAAAKYNITVEQLKKIETEGLDKEWPPL